MSQPQDLWQLQQLDSELLRIDNSLAAMPQVDTLKQLIAAKKKVSSELTRIVGKRKDIEMDIQDALAAKEGYEAEVAKTKEAANERAQNYRAINDLEAKLTSLAKRIEKVDFDLSERRKALANISAKQEQGEEFSRKLGIRAAAEKKSFDEQSEQLRAEQDRLKAERESLRATMDSGLLDRYDTAAKRFKGFAVEQLVGNVPSICRVKLQAGAYGELKRGPEISECPYCHRILITQEVEA